MKWQLNFSVGSKNYNADAEIIDTTLQIERIKVRSAEFNIVLQNNRPLLQFIELKKPFTWKIFEGEIKDQVVLNTLMQKLEQYLSQPNNNIYQEKAIKKV